MRWLRARRRMEPESGFVAVVTVMVFASFAFGCAALSVDVARMYVEGQKVQKAADVAALGAVTYMPQDFASATTEAENISARNGYAKSTTTTVTVEKGDYPSNLVVTVCSTIKNSFGAIIGYPSVNICRRAVADYSGPAPMGSPCNTFGNEPPAGGGAGAPGPVGTALAGSATRFANCSSNPQFWATVEGPNTDKAQGDRFQNISCATGTAIDGCTAGSSKNNTDYDPAGYFWLVHVSEAAKNTPIDLQLYDPEFTYTQTSNSPVNCSALPNPANWSNTANNYVQDAQIRYGNTKNQTGSTGAPFCTGDYFPGTNTPTLMTTSFDLRQQTDTLNPRGAAVQSDTSNQRCIRQYTGQTSAPGVNDLTSTSGSYDDQLAQVFHNWTSFCRFIPTRAGDYYLQVRTNVSTANASAPTNTKGNPTVIYANNSDVLAPTGNLTSGVGVNSFGIRAVTNPGLENAVSVSAYDRMPIYANADSATSIFNLIRVQPGGAGKSIAFSYFDVGDGSGSSTGSVRVVPPSDATGSVKTTPFPRAGCTAKGGFAGSGATLASNCAAPFSGGASGSNNGRTETIVIPIPDDYSCNFNSPGGCWYQVEVKFSSGANVTDVTTWTANIFGDPVRLIE
jgi:hypothetical protein